MTKKIDLKSFFPIENWNKRTLINISPDEVAYKITIQRSRNGSNVSAVKKLKIYIGENKINKLQFLKKEDKIQALASENEPNILIIKKADEGKGIKQYISPSHSYFTVNYPSFFKIDASVNEKKQINFSIEKDHLVLFL